MGIVPRAADSSARRAAGSYWIRRLAPAGRGQGGRCVCGLCHGNADQRFGKAPITLVADSATKEAATAPAGERLRHLGPPESQSLEPLLSGHDNDRQWHVPVLGRSFAPGTASDLRASAATRRAAFSTKRERARAGSSMASAT